ncbi:hypothetical protein CWATWH8502_1577 [Crocosphaera watsonii WH 8502]|uniref:Uncharacterized protein n=4 Tax=Crocosphaera watsonii TaxID=263511 RepID=T2JMY3_CROWT|nr:hypothetical protein CWATWH8502_1577 [Crocosphaera watsonii WH 8502]CCQ56782.1 hypothetical protein CWATWH0005_5102 [Crocosphaera watsonii WH 0005]CCQ64151.1 hypothetical protein CWATWH0401_4552 [Crocosphaera watsonii WH 0401]CCQ66625.1 hypothetical protein CWATWH0402_1188 [Crocosphaera watsonii WH 0402]
MSRDSVRDIELRITLENSSGVFLEEERFVSVFSDVFSSILGCGGNEAE